MVRLNVLIFGYLLAGPLASALCNRFSCRTVVMAGGVVLCAGVLISAFAPNLEFLYFSYSFIGGKTILIYPIKQSACNLPGTCIYAVVNFQKHLHL